MVLTPGSSESQLHFDERLATALMALFRDTGETEVFDALHRLSEGAVRSWVSRIASRMGSRCEVNDLVHDTFVNVYRYARSFRDDNAASFRVWVRTIAANMVKRSLLSRPMASLQALPEGLQEPLAAGWGPYGEAASREELRSLLAAWWLFMMQYLRAYEQLSSRDRRALDLVEVEGKTYAEAGAILAVGPSNMKMIMFRARRRLFGHLRRTLAMSRAA